MTSGQLVAHIADRLIVTITDRIGRQTTFKRSEYVAPDGTTAVGHGGGEILGPGGVEVRIPEDAVANGIAAILRIVALQLADLPPGFIPELPDTTIATTLQISSPEPPAFAKEVDLAFPKPADAPEDAICFIYRRMTGPNGQMAYEALDYADVEGEGADAKVVTSSYPFSGYRASVNGYSLNGLDTGGAIGSQFENYAILMWAFDDAMPGRALGGAISGRVLRVTQAPGSTTPTYVPVAGAIVSGVDVQGQPLFGQSSADAPVTFAVSQADGTYSLFDTNNKLTPAQGFTPPVDHPNRADIMAMSVGTDPNLALKTRKGTGLYKVPSLKGVWYRGMFGHDGSVTTLEEWFDPARLRDDFVPSGFKGYNVTRRTVPGHPFGLALSFEDRAALIAFLKTL